MTWPLSAFLTSLPLPFAEAVAVAVRLGFTHVDVVALAERPAADLEVLADAGVLVGCAAVGRAPPAGCSLDAADVEARRQAVECVRRQLTDAARLGATVAYLVPPPQGERLPLFAEACALLADFAAERMVRLLIEHIPGRSLATVRDTLSWLEQVGHPRLGLLLDVGHCLISGEEVGAAVRQAGERLGYVHLDDNDGVGDVHWPLLTGRLTETDLASLASSLGAIGYRGGVALELNAANPDAVAALATSKAITERSLMNPT
jgi:sugar phosphate isomerase/epimerase